MSISYYFYTHKNSLEELTSNEQKVLLLGSYIGYSNFGDILQLKGTIHFHKSRTGLKPVVFCTLQAVSSPRFLNRLHEWFPGCIFVFFDTHYYRFPDEMIVPITQINNAKSLHVYGGGFLNKMWGDYKLSIIEAILKFAEVDLYVITGQQIDERFVDKLNEHFNKFTPQIIGARDLQSANLIKDNGWPGGYSFDDASETIQLMAKNFRVEPDEQLLLHINTSSYTLNDEDNTNNLFTDIFQALKSKNYTKVTLLQMYEDRRYTVRDALESIIYMESDFPFVRYDVLNLARLALTFGDQEEWGDKKLIELRGGIAVTSSYHATMLLNFIGIPTYLISFNEYYDQKRRSLDNNGTLQQFLNNPTVPNYYEKFALRMQWLDLLEKCFNEQRFKSTKNIVGSKIELPLDTIDFSYKDDNIQKTIDDALQWQKEQTNYWWREFQKAYGDLQWQKQQTDIWWGQFKQCESQNGELNQQVLELNESLKMCIEERSNLLEEINSLKCQVDDLHQRIKWLENQNSLLINQYNETLEKNQELDDKVKELVETNQQLIMKLESLKALKVYLKYKYFSK